MAADGKDTLPWVDATLTISDEYLLCKPKKHNIKYIDTNFLKYVTHKIILFLSAHLHFKFSAFSITVIDTAIRNV